MVSFLATYLIELKKMKELESALLSTFEDYRLSKGEKTAFRELLMEYQEDTDALNFVRNKAFDIVNIHMQKQQSFDVSGFKWLEHIVKTIDVVRASGAPAINAEAYFSPGEDCKRRIVGLITHAKKTVDVCVFTISDDDISRALYSAHQRGTNVRIITDNDKANDLGSDVDRLIGQGVPTVKDISDKHMHHKFALIDGIYLINGSFNWTRSATKYNNENITVTGDVGLVKRFSERFEGLWKEFKRG